MDKIATPQDLITQLTALQERVSSEPVSRDVVASELRALADKLSASKTPLPLEYRRLNYRDRVGSWRKKVSSLKSSLDKAKVPISDVLSTYDTLRDEGEELDMKSLTASDEKEMESLLSLEKQFHDFL